MSYRSYVPSYKPSLSSSYKSGSTSAYSSKDDVNDSKSLTTPRFAAITSPAAYRPSYSGGTYRSIPIKRDSTYTPYKYTNDKSKDTDICNHKSTRYSTSTGNLSRYGPRSRDPSPTADRFSSTSSLTRAKSREPSPISSTVRRSRDPSPVSLDANKTSSISRPSVMNYPTYRMGQGRNSSSGYNSRIGISTSTNPVSRNSTPSLAERALSYMTASEIRTRAKQQRDHTVDKKTSVSKEQTETENIESKRDDHPKNESFVAVNVTSRGTSPTPPGTTTVTRTRRIDIAKTLDKTIQRSTEIKTTADKEIQSDRLDDSTKYLRYNSNSSRTSSTSWSENRYGASSKYSSSSSTTPSKNSRSENETESLDKSNKKEDYSNISSKSSPSRNNLKKSDSKSKLSPPKSYKQHSLENVNTSLLRPPSIPKTESSSKTTSSSNKESSKWANKDFRKSALNVGPTDRPRKSRTPSTGTDTEENQQSRGTLQIVQRLERSSSVGSEASSCTATSTTSTDERKRSHQLNRLSNNKSPKINNDEKLEKEIDDITNNMYNNKIDNKKYNETCENKNDPPTPPPHTAASAAALLKYLNINSTDDSSCVGDSSQQNEYTNENQTKQLHTENDKTKLVRKLGKISNFLAAQIQEDSDDEPIIFDNNSSSNSITESLKRDGSTKIKTIKSNSINSSRKSTNLNQNDNNNPIITSPTDKSQTETTDNSSWWLNTSQQINTDSALDDNMKYKLRHIDSGELAWWQRNNEDDTLADDQLKTLNQDDTEFEDKTGSSSVENSWWTKNMNGSNDKAKPIQRENSQETAWWLNNDNNVNSRKSSYDNTELIGDNECNSKTWWPNDTSHNVTNNSSYDYYLSEPAWVKHSLSNNNNNNNNKNVQNNNSLPEMIPLNNIKRIESGERPWWLNSEKSSPVQKSNKSGSYENEKPPIKSPNEINIKKSASPSSANLPWWMQNESMKKLATIKHADSGERAWWLQDEEKVEKQKSPMNQNNNKIYYEKQNESDDDDEEICQVTVKLNKNKNYKINQCDNNSFHLKLPKEKQQYSFAPPLGDRASPEGLEDDSSKSRKSPYDNIPSSKSSEMNLVQKRIENQKRKENLFISRHKNIDELLGGSCRPLSPLVDLFSSKNVFLEEVTPAQVRIHDSTAQMPVIQRMEGDEWNNYSVSTSDIKPKKTMLDDAAMQIYKEGDFGAYLDLESSLGEQTEEIEGLNSSRKNSIVVRTQLSVRVHSIIEKLLSSEGSELRRALFSLKQIFQEDKDLVHGFVALGGLNCLVRVGNGADQNYQNYILRALGQVMLYVDGMNGVMKHSPTIQWLYSLISSKYRLVVKTALKLLLVFVEYTDSNSYLLVNAIHSIDISNNAPPWSNIMKLLKDYENADTELLIYATSLINKTLSGLSDQDSFYDESDLLEQQGMEGVIQRYMSRPGTDLDLLDQLQLYEAVLKFEDGEADGICLPDNSVRKTLRYRSSNDTAERRKSRRHSTGLSPLQQSTPKKLITSPNGALDEDSSSSSNSNEFNNNNGVFRECKGIRDGAGVTPGLRRRRERAERQKSFMREQLEVGMNFGSYENNKKDQNGELGQCQIVTAVPVHLKNGDSPPESLSSLNSNSAEHEDDNKISLSSSYISPAKNILNNTSISVINSNGFNKSQQQNRISSNNEFQVNKNKIIHSNSSTVINGLMKNLQYNENLNGSNVLENINGDNYLKNKNYLSQTSRAEYSNHLNEIPITNTNNLRNSNYPVNSDSNGNQIINSNAYNYSNGHENGHENGNNQTIEPDLHLTSPRLKPNELLTKTQQQKITQQLIISEINTNNTGNQNCPSKINSTNSNGNVYGNSSHTIGSPITTVINGNPNNLNINGSNIKFCATTTTTTTTTDVDKPEDDDKKLLLQLKRDQTVKDLTQKLSNLPTSPQEDKPNRIGDMTGLISKAKEGLAKSKSRGDMSRSSSVDQDQIKKSEPKKSENELHWEELVKNIQRPLNLCDLDFTDLNSGDEEDVLAPRNLGGGIPPPPPPSGMPPPPMLTSLMPPPPTNLVPPPMFKSFNQNNNSLSSKSTDMSNTIKKNKKTVKLFWKEVREDMIPQAIGKTVWDELPSTNVDTQKLEHLFESRAKDLMAKKQQELNKSKEVIVLDHKRSNAINIAMTKLPPPRAIKAAILKMDATVVTREGIDKLLNMLPTDEEKGKIQEAQMSNPELPLGSAEQFLLTLSSISELSARLKLWAFRLDFENSEKEIAEPLMDLKQGIELLKYNRTFKSILSTLLSIGIFLNGAPVKGFQIEYLAKVPEVKDTVHKHSLLHHLCHMVMETSPDTTDLYSEIGSVTRASKADFTDLAHNLVQLETECKSSWDRLKLIAKHDCPPQLKQKLVDFLADCAERIILLQIVHRRVINRYRKFLLWLGIPQHRVAESKPNEFCKIVSEFALEYRTTRERVQQQIEKKANHRERNKTRGKMIIDIPKFRSKEDRADAELKQLLGSPSPSMEISDGTLTWRRRRGIDNFRSLNIRPSEEFTDGDDEILESLVKTATKAASNSKTTPRERKRTRHADRKSLRRTLKNGLSEEEKQHVASLIKTF